MNDQLSYEADILVTLVRKLAKESELSNGMIDEETLNNALKVCSRLEPLIGERRLAKKAQAEND
jgi:hypothetical protein